MSRFQNKFKFKKPAIWIVIISFILVTVLIIGFSSNKSSADVSSSEEVNEVPVDLEEQYSMTIDEEMNPSSEDTIDSLDITDSQKAALPKVYPDNDERNKLFDTALVLPEVDWDTDNKTDYPKEGDIVSIPSGRPVYAFLPTRPREEKSVFIDEATLKQIITEIEQAKVLPHSSGVDWARADFMDYNLNLYVLTDQNVYNLIHFWGPIRIDEKDYVNISVSTLDSFGAYENWRVESSALGQILIDTWGPKFDLKRFADVTHIDMKVLNFADESKVGNKATIDGDAARDIGKRILKTAKREPEFGSCGYNIEVCFTFSDGSTKLGWLNGDSCPGIAMDNGPVIMFDKEITREFYKLLDYGEDFISE